MFVTATPIGRDHASQRLSPSIAGLELEASDAVVMRRIRSIGEVAIVFRHQDRAQSE